MRTHDKIEQLQRYKDLLMFVKDNTEKKKIEEIKEYDKPKVKTLMKRNNKFTAQA